MIFLWLINYVRAYFYDWSFYHGQGGESYHPHLYRVHRGLTARLGQHEFMLTWGSL